MTNFKLSTFTTINELSAASGIVHLNNLLYLISDSSTFLYQYNILKKKLSKIPLKLNGEENILKKDKPDFESITLFNNKLYIHGSGSTKNRETRITYNLENQNVKQKDVSKLYNKLQQLASITANDLNIEGTIITENSIYFFQRGTNSDSTNGIFIYDKISKTATFKIIALPKVQNIEVTFTDAILVQKTIYFLAAVENTSSTYLDGEILGSFIGKINLSTLELIIIQKISDTHKFEGITLFKKENNDLQFLICEDNDIAKAGSTLYLLEGFQ
ncbi:MAG: hypothetical protein H7239_10905 [Flavobacterium sp.]|nr:hypothetical protein [Flavobacterium sp.]